MSQSQDVNLRKVYISSTKDGGGKCGKWNFEILLSLEERESQITGKIPFISLVKTNPVCGLKPSTTKGFYRCGCINEVTYPRRTTH